MSKPYVICHMMSSVDGRILTNQWGRVKGISSYEETGSTHKADAWMCGRVTMETDFASNKPLNLKEIDYTIDKTDYVADEDASSFAIAIDKDGKLHWEKPVIDQDHLILVLTETVPQKYLAYLREIGISYIFAGKSEIDFKLALEKLAALFPIKKLLLEGGGHLNGSLLNEGLIDELSFLHVPVADGTMGTPTLFEVSKNLKKKTASHLKLIEVKQLDNDILWLRYKVL
ncbi:RibD family protein [Mucilaginibacter aquaedulcis]|uniref:RibD family protein n=1 Tax=Mucilaginibacter aquaedulcis TaxID=1187081 RepID=UPI0025B4B7F2|nr:RibD family protein [Mucilaginibacter aquaedulcis]MDN3548402.1 RibD family protein [Mucilaginibacter aquaedulcis]